jgi:polyisoprenoid-binding protein YceI
MKPYLRCLTTFLLALIISTPLYAAPPTWKIDPAHSHLYFSVRHIYSTVRGSFDDFKGTVKFSHEDLMGGSIELEAKVGSINTGNTKRDSHLNSDEFFASSKYPLMTFKSTAVKHVKGNQYLVEGKLTIKDVTKSVSVPVTFLGIKDHPLDKKSQVAGLEARMTIDRLAYHVGNGKFYKMGVIGKDVDVLITFEVMREK